MLIRTFAILALSAFASSAMALNVKGNAAAGQEKSKACVACHGVTGNETSDGQFPLLAGQHPEYLVKAMQDYKTGARTNAIMLGFASALSDQDINDIAVYFSKQAGDLHDMSDLSKR